MANVEEHAERVLQIVREFEQLDESPLRDRIFELLEHIDHLHRTCVWKVFELATQLGGKGLVERMTQDPAVKTLFMLYDLIPVDPLMPLEADIRSPEPSGGAFIPLRNVGGRRPAWKAGFSRADIGSGALRAIEIDRVPVLICGVGDEVFAYRNTCGRSTLPLHLGTLVDAIVRCPWHGCRYDARTGRRLDGNGADLEPLLVSLRGETIFIATNVAATPAADAARSHQ